MINGVVGEDGRGYRAGDVYTCIAADCLPVCTVAEGDSYIHVLLVYMYKLILSSFIGRIASICMSLLTKACPPSSSPSSFGIIVLPHTSLYLSIRSHLFAFINNEAYSKERNLARDPGQCVWKEEEVQ